MNDTDLASALRAIHREVPSSVVSPALRARVLAIPATRTQRSHRRRWPSPLAGRGSLSSGIRLIAAFAILALVGGLLVVGVGGLRTAPPTLELVTEAVEPGVERVLSDGAGHDIGASWITSIELEPDGTVWMAVSEGGESLWRLGVPGSHDSRGIAGHFAVASAGTWWKPGDGLIRSYDGTAWIEHAPLEGTVIGLTTQPDGTVWAAWEAAGSVRLGSYDGDAWTIVSSELRVETTFDAWSGSHPAATLAATDAGDVWLGSDSGLWHFTGQTWETVPPDDGAPHQHRVAAGADGSVWVYVQDPAGYVQDPAGWYLKRFDGRGWIVYPNVEGVPAPKKGDAGIGRIAAGPDGSVWHNASGGGVRAFDGTAWTWYLRHISFGQVADIEIGPDGTVWASNGGAVYIIRPWLLTTD